MYKRIFLFMALVALTFSAQAKVRLPHIICDNMVLQQQSDARLWGWAEPGKTVKVTTSWSNEAVSTKACVTSRNPSSQSMSFTFSVKS